MATNAERQRAFKQRMNEAGFQQVTGWVHEHQAAALMALMQVLRDNPDLDPTLVRNVKTGRMRPV